MPVREKLEEHVLFLAIPGSFQFRRRQHESAFATGRFVAVPRRAILAARRLPGLGLAPLRSATLLAGAIVFASLLATAEAHAEAVRYHLDPAHGVDDEGRDGTPSSALRTIPYALERAVAAAATEVELVLTAGRFEAPGDGSIVLPAVLERITLRGAREGVGSTIGALPCGAILSWSPATGSGLSRLELADLSLSGGLGALEIVGPDDQGVELVIDRVLFHEQEGVALLISAAVNGVTRVDVADSSFEVPAGLVVEALSGADVEVSVRGSSFSAAAELPISSVVGVPPIGAIALHAANGSRLGARLDGNRFRNVPAAVIVSADEVPEAPGAELSVLVQNSLVDGFSTQRPYGVRDAFLLSLWDHHDLDISFVQNTIVGIEGAVIAQDNLGISGGGELVAWTFANNLCHAIGAPTEFAAEYDPRSESFNDGFPSERVLVRNNVLAKSPTAARGEAGNVLAVDPGFVAASERDYRLTATSPAIDFGAEEFASGMSVDLGGNCRVASALCEGSRYRVDAGAYERTGYCREETVFVRGDCGMDGGIQLSDPILLFNYLFLGAATPSCLDACDADDDGGGSLTDGILVLTYLFLGGTAPSPPGVRAGYDPTCDALPCSSLE